MGFLMRLFPPMNNYHYCCPPAMMYYRSAQHLPQYQTASGHYIQPKNDRPDYPAGRCKPNYFCCNPGRVFLHAVFADK